MQLFHCQCGTIYGERCEWTGPAAYMVVVEWMPDSLRGSHTAAGNSGDWPMNGAERLAIQWECAGRIVKNEGSPPDGCCWVSEVVDAAPGDYAEEV